MARYMMTLQTLKYMDEKIMTKMFEDLEDIDAVQRIADCAKDFVISRYKEFKEQSEHEEAKDIDDARRHRDINSDNRRPY